MSKIIKSSNGVSLSAGVSQFEALSQLAALGEAAGIETPAAVIDDLVEQFVDLNAQEGVAVVFTDETDLITVGIILIDAELDTWGRCFSDEPNPEYRIPFSKDGAIEAAKEMVAAYPHMYKLDESLVEQVSSDDVTLTCPEGSKSTALYIITPKFGGKDRWFEKARLTGWACNDGIYTVTLPRKAAIARKLVGKQEVASA